MKTSLRIKGDRQSLRTPKSKSVAHKIPQIFISYSHVDTAWLKRLQVHLKPLVRDGLIDLWSDTRLRIGTDWRKDIESALNQTTIAILLVSADFLASDFIVESELPTLLHGAKGRGVKIMPIIVGPCSFGRNKFLSKYQAVNPPDRPLTGMPQHEAEEMLRQVSDEIAHYAEKPLASSLQGSNVQGGTSEVPQPIQKPDSLSSPLQLERAERLHLLGIVAYKRDKYKESEEYLSEALAIRRQILGSVHFDVALVLYNLGILYHEKHEHTKAEMCLQEALDIFKRTVGPYHSYINDCHENIADLYDDMGRHAEAEDHLKASLQKNAGKAQRKKKREAALKDRT